MVIPVARLKFSRRLTALIEMVFSAKDAERLVRTVLHLWQKKSFPALPAKRLPPESQSFLDSRHVCSFADWLSEQPFNEAAYWLASTYATLVGEEIRTNRALFFTPPALAERVIDHLIDQGASLLSQHWHDPACGGAAFLVPIAQRMIGAMAAAGIPVREQISRLEKNLSGNDLDPVLLDLSRSFLSMAAYSLICSSGIQPNFTLSQGDGLLDYVGHKFSPDIIAINPPYRKLKSGEVSNYRDRHGDVIEGQPNIYGLFINRALQLPRPGGLIGLLTPTSFLSGRSFSKLRTKLLSLSDVLHLDMLSDRTSMFINVEQEIAITILRRHNSASPDGAMTRVSVLDSKGKFSDIGDYSLPSSGKPWPVPRSVSAASLVRVGEFIKFRLKDYGYIARIGHLVAYRDERKRFENRPAETTGKLYLPLVWATDINKDGCFEPGRPSKYHRIERYVEIDANCRGIVSKQSVLLQRLTSSDQNRRLVAAAVPDKFLLEQGGFICENHVIVLETGKNNPWTPQLLAELLNSKCVDQVFRSISGSSNVSISELNELPLPDPKRLLARISKSNNMEISVQSAYSADKRARLREKAESQG